MAIHPPLMDLITSRVVFFDPGKQAIRVELLSTFQAPQVLLNQLVHASAQLDASLGLLLEVFQLARRDRTWNMSWRFPAFLGLSSQSLLEFLLLFSLFLEYWDHLVRPILLGLRLDLLVLHLHPLTRFRLITQRFHKFLFLFGLLGLDLTLRVLQLLQIIRLALQRAFLLLFPLLSQALLCARLLLQVLVNQLLLLRVELLLAAQRHVAHLLLVLLLDALPILKGLGFVLFHPPEGFLELRNEIATGLATSLQVLLQFNRLGSAQFLSCLHGFDQLLVGFGALFHHLFLQLLVSLGTCLNSLKCFLLRVNCTLNLGF
mmetsp:Transcript_89683/g.142722  ORF Transcript_89683/g.142722 Transcript_89683/m.142722 type:complete len:317 (-) Transcript_89683:21-971(-)